MYLLVRATTQQPVQHELNADPASEPSAANTTLPLRRSEETVSRIGREESSIGSSPQRERERAVSALRRRKRTSLQRAFDSAFSSYSLRTISEGDAGQLESKRHDE